MTAPRGSSPAVPARGGGWEGGRIIGYNSVVENGTHVLVFKTMIFAFKTMKFAFKNDEMLIENDEFCSCTTTLFPLTGR